MRACRIWSSGASEQTTWRPRRDSIVRMNGDLMRVECLRPDRRDGMFALMVRHFENIRRSTFDRDLAEKDWVILLSDPDTGALRGFSTQMLFKVDVGGQLVNALFSGDTVVDRDHWSDSALARVWGRFALTLIDDLAG